MRYKILALTLFLAHALTFAQTTNTLTFSAQDSDIESVIKQIESLSPYRFYFISQWFGSKKVSVDFADASLDEVLTELFKETDINYYQLNENEVVLSKNNTIYDSLPEDFFQKGTPVVTDDTGVDPENESPTPIFYADETSTEEEQIETIRIGRENRQDRQARYTLSGYVRNEKTNEPIGDIAIVVTNRGLGTVSDENGYYQISLPAGRNLLETRFIGMKSVKKNVIVYNSGQLDIFVGESVQQLSEVILEADKKKNVEEEVTGTEIIDSEETKDIPLVLGERNVLQVATTLPGISTAGEGALGINVRGGKTDQNLFLMDNAVVYNPTHFFGIFQALNPFVTKSVEIYKGNIPVEFAGRLSSVFDIQTIDGNTDKFAGEASIGPVTANIALEVPIKEGKSSLVLGGRGAYSDWILRSLDDEDLSNSEASFYDVIINYTDRINENNRLKATAYYSRDNFSITSDSLFGYSNRAASVEWKHTFNERNNGGLVLSNSRYAFDIEFDGESNTDFDLGYSVEETELKLYNNFRYSDKHTFKYGIAAKLYTVNPGSIDPLGPDSAINPITVPEEKGFEGGIYIGDNFTISEKFAINAGVRYSFFAALGPSEQRVYAEGVPRNQGSQIGTETFDNNEVIETYGGPELRLSARYLITPDFSIKASVNNMYQYIHTLSNTTTVSPIDTWKLSDSNIKPQTSQQATLGFFKNFEDDMFEVSLEGFYKRSQDVLDFKTGAQLLLNQQIETEVLQGDGRAYGVEFLLRKNRGKLNGWLGYTYSRSKIRFDSPFPEERINGGVFFPSNYDRPHDVSLIANYKFTRRYSLSLNFAYQTGRPVTYPIGQFNFNNAEYVFYSNRNEFRIPDYYRLDLGVNIEGNHKIKKLAHSFWTISVYNVLGRNNPYSVFFVTEAGEVRALQSSIFAIPIPSITYNFKF
ncbi:TonB-dependent receptor [Poritiphilus flavus]|uniref:TonB-dependent receptor plug domain-containing protein n=1 Tax=Poritiphilus flavus TaxID=2697053 RepID=A0A6L9EE78_9FLAO|nr:TonB-dependent receptor [Poritiphilus flavus]NAS13064.1 TonB-dependent receptor plug domain-containing protein [Poritiphilus flavus]